MRITKFGHCCLSIEEEGLKIITDPGTFTRQQDEQTGVHVVLITHDHADHLHIDSLKNILRNNPKAKVITNTPTAELLKKQNIPAIVLDDGGQHREGEILFEAYGKLHAVMHSSIPQSPNTGFFIANKLFYPGDAFTDPKRPIDILALPTQAPWLKLAEVIDYALKLKPKVWFPVHDALMMPAITQRFNPRIAEMTAAHGITGRMLEIDKPHDF